jgi:hypothetical protein
MKATVTVYIDPSKRNETASLLQRELGTNLSFLGTEDSYLAWAGQAEIEVADQQEAFRLERELQKIGDLADLEIIADSAAEEEELNLRFVQLNEAIHTDKTGYPDADWYHKAIRIKEALDYARQAFQEGRGQFDADRSICKMALIDTGYSRHPETVAFDLSSGRNFLPGENPTDPLDTLESTRPIPIYWGGHGTSCAGVLIGRQAVIAPENRLPWNNTFFDDLVDGLLPNNLKVAPYRVSRNIISFTSKMAKALSAVANSGDIPVISMSHATLIDQKINYLATREAYEKGVILVAAPGSHVFGSKKVFTYPAKYAETIAPAASTVDGGAWKLTHGGPEVDLCAPGFEIYIPWPFKSKSGGLGYVYKWSEGSSFAVPIVATAAALWRMHHGTALNAFSPMDQVELFRSIIRKTARPFGKPTNTSLYGPGIIDFEAMLKHPLQLPGPALVGSRGLVLANLFPTDKLEASFRRELQYLKARGFLFNQAKGVREQDYFLQQGTAEFGDWFRKREAASPQFFEEFLH